MSKVCAVCKRNDRQFTGDKSTCDFCCDYSKAHYKANKKRYQDRNKKYRARNRVINNVQYQKNYRQINKKSLNDKKKAYLRRRYKTDVYFRLKVNIYQRVSKSFKGVISNTLMNVLPYTMSDLKRHLESLFAPWMNWNNYGKYIKSKWDDNNSETWTWQIDHIIPYSKLKFLSFKDENFTKCWALPNLRPYPSKSNMLDGNRRNVERNHD